MMKLLKPQKYTRHIIQTSIVVVFCLSIIIPVAALIDTAEEFTDKGFFSQLAYVVQSVKDQEKIETLSNRSTIKQNAIGLRNYFLYLIKERRIKHVHIRGDRWLLYGEPPKFTNESMVRRGYIKKLAKNLKKRKIPLFVLSTLNQKNYFSLRYPNLLPVKDGTSREISRIERIRGAHLADTFNIFKQYDQDYPLYSKLDHHPNDLGAYLALVALSQSMHSVFGEKAPLLSISNLTGAQCKTYKTTEANDLQDQWGWVVTNTSYVLNIGKFNIPFTYCYPELNIPLLENSITANNFKTKQPLDFAGKEHQRSLWYNNNIDVYTSSNQPLSPLRVLFLGNSMKINLSTYYTRYFSSTLSKAFLGKEEIALKASLKLLDDFEKQHGKVDAVVTVF